jgi:hypothetical protein
MSALQAGENNQSAPNSARVMGFSGIGNPQASVYLVKPFCLGHNEQNSLPVNEIPIVGDQVAGIVQT